MVAETGHFAPSEMRFNSVEIQEIYLESGEQDIASSRKQLVVKHEILSDWFRGHFRGISDDR
jgi:hypothetical protein